MSFSGRGGLAGDRIPEPPDTWDTALLAASQGGPPTPADPDKLETPPLEAGGGGRGCWEQEVQGPKSKRNRSKAASRGI